MKVNSSRIITIKNLTVRYGLDQTPVLKNLTLDILKENHLAVIGPSGCGKSTFAKSIVQMLPKGSICDGDLFFDEKNLKKMSKRELQIFRREKFGYIYQDSINKLNPLMTVRAHLYELLKMHKPHSSKILIEKKIKEIFFKVGIDVHRLDSYPHEFSGGMRQRVCIALALSLNPSIIIADEPTTSLDTYTSYQIMNELLSLCTMFGTTLILISHDISLAAKWCKEVVIFEDGRIKEHGDIKEVFNAPKSIIGKKLVGSTSSALQSTNFLIEEKPIILQVDNLRCWYRLNFSIMNPKWNKAVNNVSFKLFQNETLGFVGMSGSGKSTLGKALVGLISKRGGNIKFNLNDEKVAKNKRIQNAKNIQMIFQDPFSSLNPKMKVNRILEDICLIHNYRSKTLMSATLKNIFKKLDLPLTEKFLNSYPNQLSGGQLQRIAIAKALLIQPKILVCDESVNMLDAPVKVEILKLLRKIQQEMSLSIIFITHDLSLAKRFCNRLLILDNGNIVEEGDPFDVFKNPKQLITQNLIDCCFEIN